MKAQILNNTNDIDDHTFAAKILVKRHIFAKKILVKRYKSRK